MSQASVKACVSRALRQQADRLTKKAIALARAGKRGEALKLLDGALLAYEDHLDALLWRGGLSEPSEALPFLERACALAPDDEQVREGLAWTRERAGLGASSAAAAAPAADSNVGSDMPSAVLPAQTMALPDVTRQDVAANGAPRPAAWRGIGRALSSRHRRAALIVGASLLLLAVLATASAARALLVMTDSRPPAEAEASGIGAPSTTATPLIVRLPPLEIIETVTPTATATPAVTATATPGGPSLLDQAWSAEDWPQVVVLVEAMLKLAPNDAALTEKVFAAHFNHAAQLVHTEQLVEALAAFDRALAILPGDARAGVERKRATLYLDGLSALRAGDYAAALDPLRTLYESSPTYGAVKARLYQAYVGQAGQLETSGKNSDAYLAYQRAAKVDAQAAEAQAGLARLKAWAPVAPSAAGKKIEVDIAKQRVTVWESGKVLWQFKASTGKSPYLTRKGNFTVLNKIPNAYSSAMLWGMPYWMGIYQAGNYENGIHGMARVGKAQTVLPVSMLGRPATHGCIMLSDKDASTLYNWAVVGTAVWIH